MLSFSEALISRRGPSLRVSPDRRAARRGRGWGIDWVREISGWSDPLAVGCARTPHKCCEGWLRRICESVCARVCGRSREGGRGGEAPRVTLTPYIQGPHPWPRGAWRPPAVFDTLVPPRTSSSGALPPQCGVWNERRSGGTPRHYGARLLTEPALAWTSSSRGTRFENSAASVNRWSDSSESSKGRPDDFTSSSRVAVAAQEAAARGWRAARSKFFESHESTHVPTWVSMSEELSHTHKTHSNVCM